MLADLLKLLRILANPYLSAFQAEFVEFKLANFKDGILSGSVPLLGPSPMSLLPLRDYSVLPCEDMAL